MHICQIHSRHSFHWLVCRSCTCSPSNNSFVARALRGKGLLRKVGKARPSDKPRAGHSHEPHTRPWTLKASIVRYDHDYPHHVVASGRDQSVLLSASKCASAHHAFLNFGSGVRCGLRHIPCSRTLLQQQCCSGVTAAAVLTVLLPQRWLLQQLSAVQCNPPVAHACVGKTPQSG
jgi:hypothetical protein